MPKHSAVESKGKDSFFVGSSKSENTLQKLGKQLNTGKDHLVMKVGLKNRNLRRLN